MDAQTYQLVQFGTKQVRVTVWEVRGLSVIDPTKIEDEEFSDEVRCWIAYENDEFSIVSSLTKAYRPSYKQVGLALRGYAAYLDKSLPRPPELDRMPTDYAAAYGEYDFFYPETDYPSLPSDPRWSEDENLKNEPD